MKKAIALSIFALLGATAGYLAAPIVAAMVMDTSDPAMFYGSILAGAKAEVVCDCNGRPPGESEKMLSDYLSAIKKFRAANLKSEVLAQEIGLTYIRLSMAETKLDHQSQSDDDMKRGQSELAALGWKDVAAPHVVYLVTQLDSEYKPDDGKKDKNNTAAATAH